MNTVDVEYDDGSAASYRLTDEQVCDLTQAAMYGCGWFRYKEGAKVTMVNLGHATCIEVVPDERED